jgi:hypothetical protein
MSKQYYKFLNLKDDKIVSEHGRQEWTIGKEYSVKGKIVKCTNGFHASKTILQAMNYVHGDVLAVVEASGDKDLDNDKVCYRSMKLVKTYKWTKLDSVAVAIYAAEQVLHIFENKYPNDSRPRDTIKAAKAYLKTPNKKTQASSSSSSSSSTAGTKAKQELTAKINRFCKARIKKLEEIK